VGDLRGTRLYQSENAILFELGGLKFDGTRFGLRRRERDGIDEAAGVGRGLPLAGSTVASSEMSLPLVK
jgi:hypothetical protein